MAVTIKKLAEYKRKGKPIVMLTASDYAVAQLIDQAGIDMILVGDSLAMVTLGYDSTLPVTLDEILHHAKAVRRGVKSALMAVDLPFLSYQASIEQAIVSAGRALKEAGAQAVKLEGGHPAMVATVKRLVQIGIPVMAHIGLTPQSVHQFGGFRQQGRSRSESERLLEEAIALESAGAFCIVLEHIPSELARTISQKLTIPTIGIGAGEHCDGQVLVTADVLGLSDWQPPFARSYTNLREIITHAVQSYGDDVRAHRFPDPKS